MIAARRTTVALLVAVAALVPIETAAAAPTAAGPTSAAAPAPTAPRAAASSATLTVGAAQPAIAGETVTLAGRASSVRRATVTLQRWNGRGWVRQTSTRADAAGRYTFRVQPRSTTKYRVRSTAERYTSTTRTVGVATQAVRVGRPGATIEGAATRITAAAYPVRPGRGVALQVRDGDAWRTVATAKQDRAGRARFTTTFDARSTMRVVVTATGGVGARTSQAMTMHVTDAAPDEQWVTGYYAGWFWPDYPPEHVDMDAMTHFVFGRVAPGGGSLGGTPGSIEWGAISAQEPGGAPDGSGKSIERYLVDKAHAAGTKALLMLGGDGLDGAGFVRSTTDAVRPAFVKRLVDHMVANDYDGVDVDWENCLHGEADCGETAGQSPVTAAEERRRLRALIEDIRLETARRSRYADRPALITHPGYAQSINELEPDGAVDHWRAEVANLVDQYSLMSYGIGTTWNGAGWDSWFSGALMGASGTHPIDIASSIDAYEKAGVPRARLGMGIGFYGIYYGPGITGPRQNTDENDIYEVQDASLAYNELIRKGYLAHGTRLIDEEAKSVYRIYGDGGYVPENDPGANPAGMLSYEDPYSIAEKGWWARTNGIGGTILWTINYGWLGEDDGNPLLEATADAFLGELNEPS